MNIKYIIVAVLVVLGGVFVWQYFESLSEDSETLPSATIESSDNQQLTIDISNWQVYENKILGYKFEYPTAWAVYDNVFSSEGQVTVASCSPSTSACDRVEFGLQVIPYYNPIAVLPSGWSKTKVDVGGFSADKIIKSEGILTDIYFQKESDWYVITFYMSDKNKQKTEPIFDHILASFIFTTPQPLSVPFEYELLKGTENWTLTYQNRNVVSCSDGRKGNTTNTYAFAMSTQGDTNNRTSAGDINTPYAEVIFTLKNNGWQQCKTIGPTQLQETQGTSEVFIKNDRLVGVYRQYSMGVGNSLNVIIQY